MTGTVEGDARRSRTTCTSTDFSASVTSDHLSPNQPRPLSTSAGSPAPSRAEPCESSPPGKKTHPFIDKGAEARRPPRVDGLDGRASRVSPCAGLWKALL